MADNYDFIPAASAAGDTATSYDFVPVHEFDYSPIQASTKDRDELANMWMAKQDFLGGHGPQTLPELEAIKTKASAVGMSLDDVMAAAQEKMTPSERASVQRFRYAGPVGRGIVQSENSTATFLTNAAYRGLSFIPGMEHLSTKADENNRALETSGAVIDQLNREGSMAEIIGPTGASLMGNVSQGLMDVATITAVPGGAAGATEGMTAEAATAANKAAALSASKKAAIFFGVKQGEQQLTVGTDAGLSPNMRIANAAMQGSITGAFTFGFGQWAQQLGLATSEQAAVVGSGAVGRLMTREGLTEAAQAYALSGGEQAAMSTAEQSWGSVVGTDTMDDWASRTGKAGVTGAVMRGSMDVLPAARDFHQKFMAVQEKLPETVKGTLAAQKVIFEGAPAKPIENESPTYQEAYKSEIDALEKQKADAMASLDEIQSGQETLKSRIEKHLAAKRDAEALSSGGLTEDMKQQLRDMGVSEKDIEAAALDQNQKPNKAAGTGPGTETEQAAIRAERDKLAEQHKIAMGDATAADQLIAEIKAKAAGDTSAAVPFMITKVMRQKLVDTGYTPEEISNMTPQAAHDAIKTKAEADTKAHEQAFSEMSDADKDAAKSKVINDLETKRTADGLEQGSVELTRAEHELNRKFREYHGMEAMPDAERVPMESALREARAKGYVADADNIAKDIVSNGTGLTYEKQQGLLDALVGRREIRERADSVLADKNATEDAKRDAAVIKDSVRKSEDTISRAIFEGRRDVGRTLGTGQYDNTNPEIVRQEGQKRKGGELTPQEAATLTAGAEKVQDIESRARRAQGVNETEAKKPLSREGFAFRETLRAEQRKGSALTQSEADSIAATARKLYDTTADPIALDNARMHESAADMYHEANKARMALEVQMLDLEPKTFGSQVKKSAAIAGGLFREYLTGGDGPPNLRQGLLHPFAWPEMTKIFFKSLVSDRAESHADYNLTRSEFYHEGQKAGLRTLKANEPMQFQEGGMAAAVSRQFPVFRRISGAYRTAVNYVRQYAFETNIKSMGSIGKWDAESLKRCADFSNCATGTGTLGGLEHSASFLSHIMLAPRFFWSRLQYFTGWPMIKAAYAGDKVASQMMLKAYVKQVAGIAVVTALAEAGGKAAFGDDAVEFHRNPTDFDFGRLRIGGTMIDITGGLGKPFRYATSLAEPLLARYQDRPSLKRVGPTILGIAKGSLAPVPSALVTAADVYASGKDAGGELQKFIYPWSWNDSVTAMQNEGVDKGTAITLLNMFGAGGYTIENK